MEKTKSEGKERISFKYIKTEKIKIKKSMK